MTPLQIFDRAIKRISKGWTQHSYARGPDDRRRSSYSQEATCWCLSGALGFDDPEPMRPEQTHALHLIQQKMNELDFDTDHITEWNDDHNRTQEEVLSLLRAVREDLIKEVPSDV